MKNLYFFRFTKPILSIAMLLSIKFVFAQVTPIITNFSPKNPKIGIDAVTVTGFNLRATFTPIVILNGVTQSNFISSSVNQLIFTVPSGATFGKLKVYKPDGQVTGESAQFINPIAPTSTSISNRIFASNSELSETLTFNGANMISKYADINFDGLVDNIQLDIDNPSNLVLKVFYGDNVNGFILHTTIGINGTPFRSKSPISLDLIDIDNDIKKEIVIFPDFTNQNFYIYSNSGDFLAFESFSNFRPLYKPVYADFDNDGFNDIITFNDENTAYLNINTLNTVGGFVINNTTRVYNNKFLKTIIPNSTIYGWTADYLKGNNFPDIAIAYQTSSLNGISLIANNYLGGSIRATDFAPPTKYITTTLLSPLNFNYLGFDFIDDTDSSTAIHEMIFACNNPETGLSTFNFVKVGAPYSSVTGYNIVSTFSIPASLGSTFTGLKMADFDADGQHDFALIDNNGVTILKNTTRTNGFQNGFTPIARYPITNAEVLDYNRDGLPDLLYPSNGRIAISTNELFTPPPIITDVNTSDLADGSVFTVSGSNLGNFQIVELRLGLVPINTFNLVDGGAQIIVTIPSNFSTIPISAPIAMIGANEVLLSQSVKLLTYRPILTTNPVFSIDILVTNDDGTRTLFRGDTRQLRASGRGFPLQGVIWQSSNTTVASINTLGLLTALNPGLVTITAIALPDTNVRNTIVFSVEKRFISVSGINIRSLNLENSPSNTLSYTQPQLVLDIDFMPDSASDKRIKITLSQTKGLVKLRDTSEYILSLVEGISANETVSVNVESLSNPNVKTSINIAAKGLLSILTEEPKKRNVPVKTPGSLPSNLCDATLQLFVDSIYTSYQWYMVLGNDTSKVVGATSHKFTPVVQGNYFVYTENASSNFQYLPLSVSQTGSNFNPIVTLSGSASASIDDDTLLVASEAKSYQWYLNGMLIKGATKQTLRIFYNGEYHASVKNENNCITNTPKFNVSNDFFSEMARFDTEGDSVINNYGKRVTEISVFPQPADRDITVVFNTLNHRPSTIYLYNLSGILFYKNTLAPCKSPIKTHLIKVDEIPPGLYILNIANGDNNYISKVSIQK